jgi:hypothetical protein
MNLVEKVVEEARHYVDMARARWKVWRWESQSEYVNEGCAMNRPNHGKYSRNPEVVEAMLAVALSGKGYRAA